MSFPTPPKIPETTLNAGGWVKIDEVRGVLNRNIFGLVNLRAYHHTDVYADETVRAELSEKTLGRVDQDVSVFFANRTRVEPHVDNLLRGVGGGQVLPAIKTLARRKFADELRKRDIEGFRVMGKESVRNQDGEKVEMERIHAEYEIGKVEFNLTGDEMMVLNAGSIEVTGWIGVWLHDGDIFVVGGVYPSEDFERSQLVKLTDAIDMSLEINLGIWPKPYKRTLFELVRTVR